MNNFPVIKYGKHQKQTFCVQYVNNHNFFEHDTFSECFMSIVQLNITATAESY